jgi:hypothetical protein
MSLKPLDAAAPYDAIVRHRNLAIVIPERDVDNVRGAIAGTAAAPSSLRSSSEPAYVRLNGECPGSAMAAVTLRQGIERATMQSVPGPYERGGRDRPPERHAPLLPRREDVADTASRAGAARAAGHRRPRLSAGTRRMVGGVDRAGHGARS